VALDVATTSGATLIRPPGTFSRWREKEKIVRYL
jgi:hypothetical protein